MTTTTDTTPLQTAAVDALRYFEVAERTDGTRYVRLTDDAPEWLREAVRRAHTTEELPNDWRYGIARDAVEAIARGDIQDHDGLHEFADSATDVYTSNLLRWLSEEPRRAYYVDDALELEQPPTTCSDLLMRAQYAAIFDTACAMLDALLDHANTDAQ